MTKAIHSELFAIRPRTVLGILAVSEGRHEDALQHLAGLGELAMTAPYWATYPLWGDLFEALVSRGELERALGLLAELDEGRFAIE
jgi:hypothetical protein